MKKVMIREQLFKNAKSWTKSNFWLLLCAVTKDPKLKFDPSGYHLTVLRPPGRQAIRSAGLIAIPARLDINKLERNKREMKILVKTQ
jgi:hypothetical protein